MKGAKTYFQYSLTFSLDGKKQELIIPSSDIMDMQLACIWVLGRLGFAYSTSEREGWEATLEKGSVKTPKGVIKNVQWGKEKRITEKQFIKLGQ